MTCRYLEYREFEGDDPDLAHDRAYCRKQQSFVSPVRADICNDRWDFDHASHCEIFKRKEVTGEGELDVRADD